LQRGIEAAAAMNGLVQHGKELTVWSWAIAIRGDNVPIADVQGMELLVKGMNTTGIGQGGRMVFERKGKVEKNLRCQIMVQSNFKESNTYNATSAMREFFVMRRVLFRSFCHHVVKQTLAESRDWLSLAGCSSDGWHVLLQRKYAHMHCSIHDHTPEEHLLCAWSMFSQGFALLMS
jgi:hypothetical protein